MKIIDNLETISDGKIYDVNDMVKADTRGCKNCSACCQGIADVVILNPFDVYEIVTHLNTTFDDLMLNQLELSKNEKIVLPQLKTSGESERCSFLNQDDRCSIHMHRPNICRLFPLGRFYETDDFKYFLQTNACVKTDLDQIKLDKWIGIHNYSENKSFLITWYKLLKALTFRIKFIHDEEERSDLNKYLLDIFYRSTINDGDDFYAMFYKKLPEAKNRLGII